MQVLGSSPGSHAVVADVCRQAIVAGPPWQPAEDARGNPVLFETTFPCSVKAMSEESSIKVVTAYKELALGNVGAAGPLPVEQLAVALTSHLSTFTHCFESAAGLSKPIHGTHWLAFQILPDGKPGRTGVGGAAARDKCSKPASLGALRAAFAPSALDPGRLSAPGRRGKQAPPQALGLLGRSTATRPVVSRAAL